MNNINNTIKDKKLEEYISIIENDTISFDDKISAYNKANIKLEKLKNEYNEASNELIKKTNKKEKIKKDKENIEDKLDDFINKLDENIQKLNEESNIKNVVKKYFDTMDQIDKYIIYLTEKKNIIKKAIKKNKKIELTDISNLFIEIKEET